MHSTNKSFNFGQYVPNDQILNKKIHGNPKYQNVKPAVNTGSNVRRQVDELREKQKNCQHKKDEIFYRIKFLSFIDLLLEAARIRQRLEKIQASTSNAEGTDDKKHPDKTLPNVLIGIGEIDLASEKKKPQPTVHKLEKELPYLLLDVRDKEQFLQKHIKTAMHYPSALLARSIGFETEEMKLYKNSSPEIIILYDEDESIVVRVATTLVQRGYENVYVLTGGLKHCSNLFPTKPLSHLCASGLPDPSLSGSPTVVVRNEISELNEEDVRVIEQYTDYRKNELNAQNTRSGSSLSRSGKIGLNKGVEVSGTKHKESSLTYRRDSNTSLGSIDQIRLKQSKSDENSRCKGGKKAPWK